MPLDGPMNGGAGAISGTDLRGLRERAGLSQAALARIIGVPRQRIGELENRITIPERAALARYLAGLDMALGAEGLGGKLGARP